MTVRRLGLLLGAISLLAGCVSLPVEGGVQTRPGQEPVEQGAGSFDYTPSGPRPGSPPQKIVEDFLLAMQASPQSTAVARKFLSAEARATWSPERRTLVYGPRQVVATGRDVHVSLEDTIALDDRGTWMGSVGGSRGVDHQIRLVRERGEWRISNPPDSLMIPQTHFESRYQQYFVYFFDPTARVLIPEPTYLPHGEQAATLLVRRLLLGPDPRLEGVLRTFIPGGTKYVLSVPVSAGGVAEVELSRQLLRLSDDDRQMALAQLAWTLRQVTGLESMRVTVDGSPIDIPGAGSPQSVSSWAEFDPFIHWASQELFGIRDGDVVAVSSGSDEIVGQFGAREYALKDIAVDLAGERVAAVTEDGSTVVLAPRGRTADDSPDPADTKVVATGTDMLTPAWDVFGELWLVDGGPGRTTVSVLVDGAAQPVTAPGIGEQDLRAFAVSRDGSRLVAVVEGRSDDALLISRVLRGPRGRVLGLTEAVPLPLAQGGVGQIRDLAWRSPGSLAVLGGPTRDSSRVVLALVDGSTAISDLDSTAEVLHHRAVHLVAAPSPDAPLLLGTARGELFELGGDGQWAGASVPGPLFAPTFVG